MANEKLPPGIIAVHKNYYPDEEKMVKALRIVLASTATKKNVTKEKAI